MQDNFYVDLLFSIFISIYILGFSITSIFYFFKGIHKEKNKEIENLKISFSLGLMNFFGAVLLYYKPFKGKHPYANFIESIQLLAVVSPFLSTWIFFFTGKYRSISSRFEGEEKKRAALITYSSANIACQVLIVISVVILFYKIFLFMYS